MDIRGRQIKKTPVMSFFKGNSKPVVVGEITQVIGLGTPGGRKSKQKCKSRGR